MLVNSIGIKYGIKGVLKIWVLVVDVHGSH